MNILLDTQVFIWLINDDSRLGEKSKALVTTTKNQVYISFLSFFEMTIKATLGKLSFDPSVINNLQKMGIVLLPGDEKSLSLYRVFSEDNKDPFDNFLVATAKAHKLKLLTSDQKIILANIEKVSILDAHQ